MSGYKTAAEIITLLERASSRTRHIGVRIMYTSETQYNIHLAALSNAGAVLYSSCKLHTLVAEEFNLLCLHGVTMVQNDPSRTCDHVVTLE